MDYPSISGRPDHQIKPRQKKSGASGLLTVLAIILWVGLVCGGYYLAKYYIDRSIQSVQQTNAINIQALESRLDALAGEMKDIEKTLANTGLNMSSSDSTQKKLNSKIEQLDKQLQELEKSLKILKEAP